MKILLFDIDGTLIDSGGAGKLAMETAMETVFGVSEILAKIPYAGRTDNAISHDLMASHGIEVSPEKLRHFLSAYLEHLPVCLRKRPGKTLPGVVPLLQSLVGRADVLLGLLTGNVQLGARTKLSHFQLDHYFGWGGFADNLVDRNDVARSARLVAQAELGRSLESSDSIWVIADTPNDIRCARAINAKVLAVATGSHSHDELQDADPDHTLTDLSNLNQVLSIWSN